MKAKRVVIVVSIMLILAATLFLTFRQEHQQYILLIPQGYHGQVTILFDQPGAAPLTYENNKAVISISNAGRAMTSDANRSGTIQYYFVDDHGQREEIYNIPEMIHHLHTQSGSNNGKPLPETIEFEVGIQKATPNE